MATRKIEREIPPCYALVHSGLEEVAAEEITRDLGGEVKKADRGVVVFRVKEITPDILQLRTVEDIFMLAWGTDSLTYRADDLEQIRKWTARDADWKTLFLLHHQLRPKTKGKPTYRLVTQMSGSHGYKRQDAGKALYKGMLQHLPDNWLSAEENAWVEIWLTIRGAMAVCGLRLSDRQMRHREYKLEHLPASLRPTIAAAMVRLAGAAPEMVVVDPMCGAGTIVAEQIELSKKRRAGRIETIAGDADMNMLRAAETNLKKVGPAVLAHWDARRLPLPRECADRIISNPPFGKQISTPEEIGPLYRAAIREADRILKPGGRAVYLTSEQEALRQAIKPLNWKATRTIGIEVLGQDATISVWQKPVDSGTL